MKNNFKFLVAAFAIVALSATTASAAYTHTGLLKQGSKGAQVMALQQTLNMTDCKVATSGAGSKGMETSNFGPATKAAVQCFQRVNALGADGVVGAMTGAKLSAIVVTDSTLPAGCSSTAGYSTTTGIKCSTTTGTGTTTPSTGSLQGGAGNLVLSTTTKDVKSNVAEGTTEKVLGYKAKAEDSDLAITNVKITLEEGSSSNGSYRVEKYFDTVSVWLGDTKVGEVDGDEFNRDGKIYTKSIALSNAVIRADKEANLYVGVEALSNVDNTAKTFKVTASDMRYTDATGAILSATAGQNNTFGFKAEGADDKLSIKNVKSTADTLKVDADDESDEYTVLKFNLETGTKSGDITVNEMFVDVNFASGTTHAADVLSYIEANGVEGDLVSSTATTARYSFDFDEDFVIDGDDSEEVEIVVAFSAQDGTFADNTKVTFTVSASQIIAEGSDDVSNLSGTATSKTQTLSVSSATVDGHKWQTAVNETVGNIDFFFTVDADDEDYDVLTSSISATASSGVVGTLELVTGDASTIGGGFKVESGDTATFRVRYNFNTSGTKEVKMTSVAGKEVPQDKQLSPSILLK